MIWAKKARQKDTYAKGFYFLFKYQNRQKSNSAHRSNDIGFLWVKDSDFKVVHGGF